MTAAGVAPRAARESAGTGIALIAVFAALVAASGFVPAIPLSVGVPITIQTLVVLLAGLCLGPTRGLLAVLLYLILATVGLPILSGGRGGPAWLAGPSAGYLIAFPLAAWLAGFAANFALRRFTAGKRFGVLLAGALVAGWITTRTLGIAGMMLNAHLPLGAAFTADLAFWPGDALKTVAAVAVALAIHRAFPRLLARR
ncbi:biotin transporter BioY [Brevibacterium sp. 91QC2O2]|uniref:biotin transporter BioY n=1 Tax=Brevibacterium sp. 91QC2O2 TaxID=2968458 RepID=UPI00211C3AF7|nr:biotin transporter BioY [Brevibacterium sp. 91QC2O2]MCQ9367452.1 biotin transporter BioY [Brevibacterium sp. 91QC2O2]